MAATQPLTLSFPQADVALLTFDTPGTAANVLSRALLADLSAQLDELEQRQDLAGLVIASGKPGVFIAGADLREFAASLDAPREDVAQLCHEGQRLFTRLAGCPFVTVAAIDGVCLGGGAELAVWCDRRVMSDGPRTEIGFPEVKLGIFPGWGGTARTPRIVGLGNAVELITGGESIDANQARKLGLASDIVPADDLIPAAIRIIRQEQQSGDWQADRERWSGPLPISETELGFLGATASAVIRGQTKGNYPAPEAALEVMLGGAAFDAEGALALEAEGMAPLFGSPVMRALLNVFFLTDRNKKDRGVEGDVTPRDIQRAGVIGAGLMGSGIAAANIKREIPVTLTDADAKALTRGTAKVIEEVAYDRKTKRPDAQRAIQFAPLLQEGIQLDDLAQCDLVVEAIVENAEVKKQVFTKLEPLLADDAILASNTSTLPITKLAADISRPERFIGIHFFNPVRRMKLVEIIRGEQTSDAAVATAVAYAKRLGKMPVVVNDGPGFMVNRLLFAYMNEAIALVTAGVPIPDVEKAAKRFGMPVGPMQLYDMVGIDTALYCGTTMYESFPGRVFLSPILPAIVKAGRLGEKTGRGFYSYENKKQKAQADPELQPILDRYVGETVQLSSEQLQDRLFLPMVLEATRLIDEQIVRDPRDIDLGVIFGLGFPPFKGGLLFWADTLGAAEIIERTKPWAELGERFEPTPLLRQLAANEQTFYGLGTNQSQATNDE